MHPAVLGVGLCKRFGATRALHEVSLEVQPGEVRALVGRNGAGKSTLVSLLTGMVAPDTGTLHFSGMQAPSPEAREQWSRYVACVYQHPKIVPTLSCTENLLLGTALGRERWISWGRMRREACRLLEQWHMDVDPDAIAGSLTVGQRQLLEIARALMQGSRFVILDEPTAKLDSREADRLFAQLRRLQSEGVGVLFISHHLDEIFEIAHSVTVLRDGQKTLDRAIAGLDRGELIESMVGPARMSSTRQPRPTVTEAGARVRLAARNLGCQGYFEGLSFEVRAGECVGLAGLAGSGKEAVGEVLAGLRRFDAGTIHCDDTLLPGGDVHRHNRAGIGFVPQDRHREGVVLGLSVADNATMTVSDRLGRLGFLAPGRLASEATRLIRELDIKVSDARQAVSDLSGGNQQKVVFARALARDPAVLVLINPTSGVDVASKAALFDSIRAAAACGTAVLVISDELEELELCERVCVIRACRLTREFVAPWSEHDLVAEMEGIAA